MFRDEFHEFAVSRMGFGAFPHFLSLRVNSVWYPLVEDAKRPPFLQEKLESIMEPA
jgi:hypothetical protein